MQLSHRGAGALQPAIARANAGGRNPRIRAEQLADDITRLVCDTYAPMLVALVSDAFEAELGPDWQRDAQFVV